jgi:carbon-monoxide dehydrogenase small subunit
MTRIALTVNGKPVAAEVAPRTHLADFLRENLLLTGTHIGCEHGICGACTVEIDGEIARSCITYAVACDGAHVRTIEGFDNDALMARMRQAFTEAHALQCGYCTPGMLIAARDLVRRRGRLARPEIRSEMSGNLCRCTGYMGIVDAIERVMAETATSAADVIAARSATQSARQWLGPAPGPVVMRAQADTPSPARPATTDATGPDLRRGDVATGSRAARSPAGRPRAPIMVTVGGIEEADGQTRIRQTFVLPHPRDAVWALMCDVEKVAPCMPGLALDGPPQGDKVYGRLEARIGPIAARFAGEGTIRQLPAEFRQVVEGRGADRRSGSHATGSVDWRLTQVVGESGGEATRVDVVISYALAGMLAQIGRSGLVRDVVRRIGETFAQNLDACLGDKAAEFAPAQLGGLTLLWQIVADRVRALLLRISGRRA